MDVEKSTGLVFGFFVALMLLDFDTLEKRVGDIPSFERQFFHQKQHGKHVFTTNEFRIFTNN